MKIGIYDPGWRGHSTTINSSYTKYFVERGHQVEFITSADNKRLSEYASSEQLSITTIPKTPINFDNKHLSQIYNQVNSIYQMKKSIPILLDNEVDIIHFTTFDYNELAFYLTSMNYNTSTTPIIGSVLKEPPQIEEIDFSSIKQSIYNKLRLKALENFVKNQNNHIIVYSESMKKRIIKNIDAVKVDRISFVHAPTPSIPLEVSKQKAREELDLPKQGVLLLFFGPLRHDKGPDILVKSLNSSKIAKYLSNHDISLNVVFAGSESFYSQADLRNLKNNNNVNVMYRTDFIPESKVYPYFIASDALILPYRRDKGVSGPMRRACMSKTHVIGPNNSDLGMIIETNKLGQTFDIGSISSLTDVLMKYLDNPSFYPKEGIEDYRELIHWQNSGREILRIYNELL